MAKPSAQDDRTCCGVIQEAKYEARAKRLSKPQPWIILKFAVAVTVGLIVYASYVYIGRFCVPMLLKNEGALGEQAMGAIFTVVFCYLLVMTMWTYIKIVLTPPGYARDHVSKTEEPQKPPALSLPWNPDEIGGTKYEEMPSNSDTHSLSHKHTPGNSFSIPRSDDPSAGRTAVEMSPRRHKLSRSQLSTPARGRHDSHKAPGDPSALQQPFSNERDPESAISRSEGISKSPSFARTPPTTPILLPEYRYCARDGIIKPYRTHHCRACGTCVLKYDHHCPWIGQCVGARNHKFFVNCLLWACFFCTWTFSTLLALFVRQGSSLSANVDPQEIVIIAIAGIFSLFTAALFISHVHMICSGQTTVEAVGFRSMRHREERILGRMYPWYSYRAMKQAQRQWDAEWGRIGKEGNIWWLGSSKENWEAIMGRNVWWWFLPIGHSSSDGLDYPVNPRFDAEGRWRRRAEWPPELR